MPEDGWQNLLVRMERTVEFYLDPDGLDGFCNKTEEGHGKKEADDRAADEVHA